MHATSPRSSDQKLSFEQQGPSLCARCTAREGARRISIVRRAAVQFLSTATSLLWFERARNAPRRADVAKLVQESLALLSEGEALPTTLRLFTQAKNLRDELENADALEQVVLRAIADMLRALAVTPTAEQASQQVVDLHAAMLERARYAVADAERLQSLATSRCSTVAGVAARLRA